MDDMLQKIIDMDKKAQKLDEKNQNKKENLEKEILEIKQNIYDEYMEKAKVTAKENEEEIIKAAEDKWNKDEATRAEVMNKLVLDFEKNQDKWVDTIVERVLS
jgi:hypothetical protein